MSGLGLTFLRRGGQAHPSAGSDYILSENRGDPEVFRILMEKGVSSDGVGITKDDAAKVTSIGTWFNGNKVIQNFDEFEYFTAITALGNNTFLNCTSLVSIKCPPNVITLGGWCFQGCTALEKADMPPSVTTIQSGAFAGCGKLSYVGDLFFPNVTSIDNGVFRSCSSLEYYLDLPFLKTISNFHQFQGSGILGVKNLGQLTTTSLQMFGNCLKMRFAIMPESLNLLGASTLNGCTALECIVMKRQDDITALDNANAVVNTNNCPIYVPDDLIDSYKAATGWSAYASRIKGLSSFESDNPVLFNEIKDYL